MTVDERGLWPDYRGLTPRPDDFDSFWEERMGEADAAPLDWELTPAKIEPFEGCDFRELWFRGIRGERLYAKFLMPRAEGPVPLVLQFHGYPGATRSWFEQASFVGMGCALIALDNPGQGGRSQDVGGYAGTTVAGHLVVGLEGDPRDLYYVRLYQDLRILCRIVRQLGGIDLTRVCANGASQGGAMALACAALNRDLIARASVLYPFLSDFRKVFELGRDEVAYEGLRYYSRWFDPDGTREDEWFGKLAYVETNHFARLVRCPVLFGTGLLDDVVPPPTQCACYNELACEKTRRLFPEHGHVEIEAFDDEIIDFLDGRQALYEERRCPGPDQGELRLMHVAPRSGGARPLVLLFHDSRRVPRGWHHLTRYVALGYQVLQLVDDPGGAGGDGGRRAAQLACAAYDAALTLPGVDASRIIAFGEGLGGSLALCCAAARPLWKAAALNPHASPWLLEHAHEIGCEALMGTGRLDELSSPASQDELAGRIPRLVRKDYPRYGHERINAFENELLSFFHA